MVRKIFIGCKFPFANNRFEENIHNDIRARLIGKENMLSHLDDIHRFATNR